MSCECIKTPAGNGKGNVQGYTVSNLCAECEAQRVIDEEAQVEQKAEEDAKELISKRIYDDAKQKLIDENVIEDIDGIVKIK